MSLAAPVPLAETHDTSQFNSGESSLDHWLRQRALTNQIRGASRTFVACEGKRVLAYYALASGSISPQQTPGNFRRNMPDPVPVVLLGRLAVDLAQQGRGLGRSLLYDAARRVSAAADLIGIRGIAVRALSESARNFYLALGFTACPGDPLLLVITLNDIRALLPNG